MLHDDERGLRELADQTHGRVDVEEVVVRDFLAVELLEQPVQIAVERGGLMRVLTVAQRRAPGQTQLERVDLLLTVEITEDGRVVVRADVERMGRETAALLERRRAMLRVDDFEEFGVLVDRRYDHDVLEIFRCGADQRDASDVDLLDDVLLGRARSDGLLERIEVDDHRVDLGYFVLRRLFGVFRVVAAGEDAAENFRVERLDASAEDRRIARQAFDRGGLQTQRLDEREGPSGGVYRNAVLGELSDDPFQSVLVVNRNESAFYLFHDRLSFVVR